MLESDIEEALKNGVEALGGLCIKLVSPGFAGIPDRLILMPGGMLYFIETKQPGKDLRLLQNVIRLQLLALGFKAYKIDTMQKVKQFLTFIQK